MKVLITGSNGLLGQNLIKLVPNNVQVLGIDLHKDPFFDKTHFSYKKVDITQSNQVGEIVSQFEPGWIVNTAALTDVDACEIDKKKCWRLNVEAVENLVYAASKAGSRIVQLSTDYVFDGSNPPYNEESKTNPICYYGKSKLASEKFVLKADSLNVIARTAVLYGHGVRIRQNFVTWVINKLCEKQKINIVDDQIGNTTFARELAATIWEIINLDARGIFHLSGREIVSRYDFALQIAKVFELNESLIRRGKTAELGQKANRPLNSGLSVEKAVTELKVELSDVRGGLLKFRNQKEALE